MIPLRDDRPSGRFPAQTVLIICITIFIFYQEVTRANIDDFLTRYALIPKLLDYGTPVTLWPLVTATFLHGSLLHIIINIWFLWIFGDNVEKRLGFLYVPSYIFGGIVGNVVQSAAMPDSPIPILGASGAVAAVLGMYLVLFPRHRILTLLPVFFIFTVVHIPATVALVIWFMTQFLNGYAAISTAVDGGGGVAWFAHVGGFGFGLIVGLLTAIFGRNVRQ